MKKLILSAIMLVGLAFSTQAQEIRKNALGLRLGSNDGFGGELSYQRGLSDNNRLEFDLGWRNSGHYDAMKLVGLYQWVWNIDGGFNWYAGVGGGVGQWSFNDDKWNNNGNNDWDDSGTFFLVAGDIGIEYVFDIPLQLSLDVRPELSIGDSRGDFDDDFNSFGPDIALGIRFTF
jgi:hypothetical protein